MDKVYITSVLKMVKMYYYFTNIVGTFVFDAKLQLLAKFDTLEKAKKKYAAIKPVTKEQWPVLLAVFKDQQYYAGFREENFQLTKAAIKAAVFEDQFIIQAISNLNELDHVINILVKRLREWYGLYNPELEHEVTAHEKFVELVFTEKKAADSMGAELDKVHLDHLKLLAKEIQGLFALRQKHELYLQKVMTIYCPNILELAGATIGAKLIELAKGLKRMALLPASTIQLLGAEKALFRHLKTGSRSPKYGVIFQHPLIQKAPRELKGKAARVLADKLSLCARLDYFKGEFKAGQYKKEIEAMLR